mgnify:CR=1 FL=1
MMKKISTLLLTLAIPFSTAFADTSFTVANTFEDPKMTGGKEISTIAFSPEVYANHAARVTDQVELPNFVNFYSIDVAADMSSLTMTVSPTAKPASNPMPDKRFDRYYYTFTGAGPAEASVNSDSSTAALAQGASVAVLSTGRLLVTFAKCADFTHGNKLVIKLK